MPRKWAPLAKDIYLKEDHEIIYRDINSAMSSCHSFDATAEAVMAMTSDSTNEDDTTFDLTTVDLIACGSTLGNLLRFTRQNAKRFRFLVYKVENTVHLIRREDTPKEIIEGVRGFGHTFPAAYTTLEPCVRDSVSHQRIYSYKLGDMQCLFRFEADGYFPNAVDEVDEPAPEIESKDSKEVSVDVIDQLFSETTLEEPVVVKSSSDLALTKGGKTITNDAIFDLKTRSIKLKPNTEFIIEEEMPRLWARQSENFMLAFHTRGKFDNIEIHEVKDKVKAWELEHAESLARLISLLGIITKLVSNQDEKKLEIVCENFGTSLQIHEVLDDVPFPMSEKTKEAWAAKLRG